MEHGNYVESQKQEKNTLNDAEDSIKETEKYIKKITTGKNDPPVLEKEDITNDLDETKENWIKVKTSGTDKDGDTLDYTLKLWKKENEEIDEEELLEQEPTKKIEAKDMKSGEEVTLETAELEEYAEYLLKVEVTDKVDVTEGKINRIKTYCSGKKYYCDNSKCQVCGGTGTHDGTGIKVRTGGTSRLCS